MKDTYESLEKTKQTHKSQVEILDDTIRKLVEDLENLQKKYDNDLMYLNVNEAKLKEINEDLVIMAKKIQKFTYMKSSFINLDFKRNEEVSENIENNSPIEAMKFEIARLHYVQEEYAKLEIKIKDTEGGAKAKIFQCEEQISMLIQEIEKLTQEINNLLEKNSLLEEDKEKLHLQTDQYTSLIEEMRVSLENLNHIRIESENQILHLTNEIEK